MDPGPFYELLARDTIEQLRPYAPDLRGCVVDIGGGPGYLAEAVSEQGATCIVIDSHVEELHLHGSSPQASMVGDGCRLPVRSGIADVAHCSNVLEHVVSPYDFLAEMVRVLRPGGTGYVAFTPWLSPWGGHETSPWHYLGGERAAHRYERRTGRPPRNRFGESLFPLRVPPVRRWFEQNDDAEVLWQGARYWPASWQRLFRAGAVGEALSWNHLVIFRRSGARP